MPDIGPLHPIVVHFVIALGFVGIALRLLSFAPLGRWMDPAASALLILAAGAGVVAAKSGEDAHGPAERIPGARTIVREHEEQGERARNLLLVVGLLEVGGLAVRRREGLGRGLKVGSAVVGLVAGAVLFEAGEHGGELVYAYAGGVGTRDGNPDDVRRLLVAGLHHQARVAREAGRAEEAARLTDELLRQEPDDPAVRLGAAESALRDRQDAAGARSLLVVTGPDEAWFLVRRGLLLADAFAALGHADSARMVLEPLAERFPERAAVRTALEKLR